MNYNLIKLLTIVLLLLTFKSYCQTKEPIAYSTGELQLIGDGKCVVPIELIRKANAKFIERKGFAQIICQQDTIIRLQKLQIREYNNIKKEVINMANTNVTMRIDETLKSQLQELMSSLGLDMTTFFTMAAKQAVREQALPFKPDMNTGIYGLQAYKLAMQNTNYNQKGKAVISPDDEWKAETEWDDMFEQMKKERGIE